jgi:DNA polymerase III subunit gamma/tau
METLYNKHRPKTLDDFLGNKETIESIQSILRSERSSMPHTILLTGPSGCGKTTLAKILARELVGEYGGNFIGKSPFDFLEFDKSMYETYSKLFESGQFPSIWFDLTFDLKDLNRPAFINMKEYIVKNTDPMPNKRKVFLFEEAHALSHGAQEALLKFIEDTPDWAYTILCTTEPDKLLETIRNRCIKFEMKPLSSREIKRLLREVCYHEGKNTPLDNLEIIAKKVNGSARDALTELEKIINLDQDALRSRVNAVKPTNMSDCIETFISQMYERPKVPKWVRTEKTRGPEGIQGTCHRIC